MKIDKSYLGMYCWTNDKVQKILKNPISGMALTESRKDISSDTRGPMLLSVEGKPCRPDECYQSSVTMAVPPPSPNQISSFSGSHKIEKHEQGQSWKTPGEIAIVIGRTKNKMKVTPAELPHTLQCFSVKFTKVGTSRVTEKRSERKTTSAPNEQYEMGAGSLAFHTQNQRAAGHLANIALKDMTSSSSTSLPLLVRSRKRNHKNRTPSINKNSPVEDILSSDYKFQCSFKLPPIIPGMTLVGGTVPIETDRSKKLDISTYRRSYIPLPSPFTHSSSDSEEKFRLSSPSGLSELIDRVRAVNSPRPVSSLTWQTDTAYSDVTIPEREQKLYDYSAVSIPTNSPSNMCTD